MTITEWLREMRAGIEEGMEDWRAAGLELGDGWRETTLGAARLAGAFGRMLGFLLTDLAAEADAWVKAERANPANASVDR